MTETDVETLPMIIYIDYVNIDQQERTLFHTNEIDYFYDKIEPPIIHKIISNNEEIPLPYTKPVKEIIMIFTKDEEDSELYDFQKLDGNIEVILNNIKLETTNDETYFRLIQPYYHERRTNSNTYIYMYSFSLDPDNMQPTGQFNFGNLKDKMLKIKGDNIKDKNYVLYIYANTNNVLKVKEGQSSVQFI